MTQDLGEILEDGARDWKIDQLPLHLLSWVARVIKAADDFRSSRASEVLDNGQKTCAGRNTSGSLTEVGSRFYGFTGFEEARSSCQSEMSNRIGFDSGAMTYFLARLNASVRSRAYNCLRAQNKQR
jgi:hypothetical protein